LIEPNFNASWIDCVSDESLVGYPCPADRGPADRGPADRGAANGALQTEAQQTEPGAKWFAETDLPEIA